MKNELLNIPALFFYGLLCGALAVVFMVSFQHFQNFYKPEVFVRNKYVAYGIPLKMQEQDALKPQKVTISLASQTAKDISLVGDFNAWGAYPLTLNKSGKELEIFTITLALPTGKYKYHFLVDGKITLDESAPKTVFNGETYNILEVK